MTGQRDASALAPLGPIDSVLAMAAAARRPAAGRARHLLPSAPLLDMRARRIGHGASAWASVAGLAWRNPTAPPLPPVPGAVDRPEPGWHRERLVQRFSTTSPLAVPVSDRGRVAASAAESSPATGATAERGGPREVSRGIALSIVRRPVDDEARGFGVAPGLVWFARWRELRLLRTQEGVSSPLVGVESVRRATRTGGRTHLPPERALAIGVASEGRPLRRAVPVEKPRAPQADPGLERRLAFHASEGATGPRAQPARGAAGAPPTSPAPGSVRTTSERAPHVPRTTTDSWLVPRSPRAETLAAALTPALGQPDPPGLVALPAATVGQGAPRLLSLLTDALDHRIVRHVREEIARQKAVARAARPVAKAAPAGLTHSAKRADEPAAGVLLERMRGLLLEERFRHGRLR